MRLYLVRHGETAWNHIGRLQGQVDIDLNPVGLVQARKTATVVAALKPTALYASPLRRTMQVAEEISCLATLPIVECDGLMELALGDLEGVTGEEIQTRWPEFLVVWRRNPARASLPNGESLPQLQQRAWNTIREMQKSHSHDDVVIAVSHNFTIRTIISKLLGLPLSNFHRMTLSLGAISAVEFNHRVRHLVYYNSTSHLGEVSAISNQRSDASDAQQLASDS